MNPLSSHYKIAIRLILWLMVISSSLTGLTSSKKAQAASQPAPIFNQCSVKQKAVLTQALRDAESLALNSFQVLKWTPDGQRANSTRYKEWFGSYRLSNYAVVMNHFQHIYEALASQVITFDCGCHELLYAYVHPDQPYKIILCFSFWWASPMGWNSRAGTLVHEMSHFTVVAGTEDFVYGQTFCRLNAQHVPTQAINNADSYRYYAENDPQLEPRMPVDQLVYTWGTFLR